ncbi:MAG: hypothetical protein KDA60_11980 [Planctomycetales bacterium]|nr:hypothetical protein [Planctomycetales bacterium]
MKTPSQGRCAAFTTIELLASLTLTSLLLVAVLGLVGLLAKGREELSQQATSNYPPIAVESLLRDDLANSTQYELTVTELKLLGHAARWKASTVHTHRPTEIVYSVFQLADGDTWLRREEVLLDSESNKNRTVQLVMQGVTQIRFQLPGELVAVDEKRTGKIPRVFVLILMGSGEQPRAVIRWAS